MHDELTDRLRRYSEACVAYKLDADFASAVQEAAETIEEMQRCIDDLRRQSLTIQHGRLIDADKLRAAFPAPEDWRNVNEALHHVAGIWAAIEAAETVVPAEGKK